MTPPPLAFDGSGVDGSWYLDVTDFARATPWLDAAASAYSSLGVALFAVLIAIATVAALLMGASRVYVGANYPHDVVAGIVVGAVVGLATAAVPTAGRPRSAS
ncbi:membrane-associated phospholipid phosphatase [Rhodococcus sp. LBL1]|nr:membrane-associated phospholipid phosphatase [Rhodococcus sp. LBL1]MDH6681206.1 membrane-associated phospholipid phosphatase [Rhodococcus sp. LBL2]